MKSIDSQKTLLSLSNTALLRIVFEAMVLIHHLYMTYTAFGAVIAGAFGPIAVGGFVFLSGYGVGFSFLRKREEYAARLIKSRVPRTYAILLIVNLCYLALYLATNGSFDNAFSAIISVLYLPIFKGFVPLSHWIYFLADLIIYYLLFSLFICLFRKTKNRLVWAAISILILDLIIIAALSVINYRTGSTRYLRACLCFPIGLICAAFCDKLTEIVKKHKPLLAIGLSAISVAVMVFCDYRPVSEYLLPILSVLAIIVILHGVNTESRATAYLSGLVIYVYVSHEFFLNVFRPMFPTLHKNAIALIVFASSMLFAAMLHSIVRALRQRSKASF